MKIYKKLVLMASGVAVATSAFTVMAMSALEEHASGLTSTWTIDSDKSEDMSSTVLRSMRSGVTPVGARSEVATDFTRAAEQAINGVVSIKSYVTARRPQQQSFSGFNDFFDDPFFDFFFGTPRNRQQPKENPKNEKKQEKQAAPEDDEPQQQLGLGSGVIISPDGYIVTNNHVIDGAERLEITLNDNSTYNAKVIGADKATDLALIKIEAKDLPVIPMGDSDALKVGEWVLAVGNPFGFTSTVTTGIVSAKARNISAAGRSMGIESYIQTDAAVNPGNSGGALVNLDGELVGINAAIYSQTGNYAGYSFAIPTSLVQKVVADIKEFGTVQRPFLGLTYSELTPRLRKEKKITATNDGLYVAEVAEGKAAAKAGIKEGDVITHIGGEHIGNSGQLYDQLNRHRPGDEIEITYIRDNKPYSTKVTLYNDQGSTKAVKAPDASALGAEFKTVDEETLKQLGIKSGLEIASVTEGKFKRAGLYKGFIITDINNVRVTKPEDVEKLYLEIMGQKEYDHVMFITGVSPAGSKRYYAVDLTD